MASFTERVQVLIDVTGEKAASSLSTFKDKIGEADGAFGKLKAGASGAFDLIGAAGPLAVAGVAAGVAKAVEGMVSDFENLALSASKFSTASGLGVEDASRWMEVAGDVGVNVGTLEGAIEKMNLAVGKGTLAQARHRRPHHQRAAAQLAARTSRTSPTRRPGPRKASRSSASRGRELAPLVESSKNLKQALSRRVRRPGDRPGRGGESQGVPRRRRQPVGLLAQLHAEGRRVRHHTDHRSDRTPSGTCPKRSGSWATPAAASTGGRCSAGRSSPTSPVD